MPDPTDLGTLADKTGTGSSLAQLTTSYTAGNSGTSAKVAYAGRGGSFVVWVELATANSTNVTSAEVKIQTSYDGVRWVDVACDSLDGAQPGIVEQTVAVSAGSTAVHAFGTTSTRLLNYQRVMVKVSAGGVLASTDRVTVKAKAGF